MLFYIHHNVYRKTKELEDDEFLSPRLEEPEDILKREEEVKRLIGASQSIKCTICFKR